MNRCSPIANPSSQFVLERANQGQNKAVRFCSKNTKGCLSLEPIQRMAKSFFEMLRSAVWAVWSFAVSIFYSSKLKEENAKTSKPSLQPAPVIEDQASSSKPQKEPKRESGVSFPPAQQPQKTLFIEMTKAEKASASLVKVEEKKKSEPLATSNLLEHAAPVLLLEKPVAESKLLPLLRTESIHSIRLITESKDQKAPSTAQQPPRPAKILHFPKEMHTSIEKLELEVPDAKNDVDTIYFDFRRTGEPDLIYQNNQLKLLAEKIRSGKLPSLKAIQIERIDSPVPLMTVVEGLVALVKALPRLEKFDEVPIYEHLPPLRLPHALLLALSECPQLKSLNFNIELPKECPNEEFLHQISKNWSHLQNLTFAHFSLFYPTTLDPKLLKAILSNCKSLRKLNLSFNNIDKNGVAVIAECCSKLEELDLRGKSPILNNREVFGMLACGCVRLMKFSCYDSYDEKNRTSIPIPLDDFQPFTEIPYLVSLRVENCEVTKKGLGVLNSLYYLQKLELIHANLTSEQFSTLLRPPLRELIVHNGKIKGPIMPFVTHRLTSLRLDNTDDLKDEDVVLMLEMLPELKQLTLMGMHRFSDNILRIIGTCCPKLEELQLNFGYNGFSKDAVEALKKTNPRLKGSYLAKIGGF